MKFLLALGTDPNGLGVQGRPLHHAVRCGDAAVVELLLRRGAEIDGHDLNGHSALLIACATGDRRLVALLLDRGADLDGVSPDYSPMRAAARNNRVEVVKDLLARGAKPAQASARVAGEVQVAAAGGAADVIPLLVAAGVPVETKNEYGETPLFFAARRDGRTTQAMVKAGANVNVTNDKGATPLMVAVQDCLSDSVRVLVAAGADPRVRDREGQSLPEMARKCANGAQVLSALSSSAVRR